MKKVYSYRNLQGEESFKKIKIYPDKYDDIKKYSETELIKNNNNWYVNYADYINKVLIYGDMNKDYNQYDLFITNSEEDTDLLNGLGYSAMNFASFPMTENELIKSIPQLFRNFKRIYIINDFLENLKNENFESIKKSFLEKLDGELKINQIMQMHFENSESKFKGIRILNLKRINKEYKTITDMFDNIDKPDKSLILDLIETAEKYYQKEEIEYELEDPNVDEKN